jgi:hypothetical protein
MNQQRIAAEVARLLRPDNEEYLAAVKQFGQRADAQPFINHAVASVLAKSLLAEPKFAGKKHYMVREIAAVTCRHSSVH